MSKLFTRRTEIHLQRALSHDCKDPVKVRHHHAHSKSPKCEDCVLGSTRMLATQQRWRYSFVLMLVKAACCQPHIQNQINGSANLNETQSNASGGPRGCHWGRLS